MHTIVIRNEIIAAYPWMALSQAQGFDQAKAACYRRMRNPRGLPLAWLRFEPPEPERRPELRCTLWPGGHERLLAMAHAHVDAIEWCA